MSGFRTISVMMQNDVPANWLSEYRSLRVLQVSILHDYFDN